MYLISNPNVSHSFSNSQTWWTWVEQPQIHAWTMKMRPKLEKINLSSYERISLIDNNQTSPIWFGCVFHEIWPNFFCSQSRWKVSLMRFDEWKSWKLGERMLLCVRVVWEDYILLILQVHTLWHFDELKKNLRTWSQSSQLLQISLKLSLLASPLVLQS